MVQDPKSGAVIGVARMDAIAVAVVAVFGAIALTLSQSDFTLIRRIPSRPEQIHSQRLNMVLTEETK